jgi:cytochrome c oxidase cbb3-type subunit 3
MTRSIRAIAIGLGLVLSLAVACKRETRPYRDLAPGSVDPNIVALTSFHPGGPPAAVTTRGPFDYNAYGLAEGKRLFAAFNCTGCHLNGGGGIGPALMDDKWIYGAAPEQIYSSILQGRPNGMPSFGGKIPETQAWQLVAYVQSLGGRISSDAAPGRNDDLQAIPPEGRLPKLQPRQTGHR